MGRSKEILASFLRSPHATVVSCFSASPSETDVTARLHLPEVEAHDRAESASKALINVRRVYGRSSSTMRYSGNIRARVSKDGRAQGRVCSRRLLYLASRSRRS